MFFVQMVLVYGMLAVIIPIFTLCALSPLIVDKNAIPAKD